MGPGTQVKWSLRKLKGPRSWPVIGATVEQLRNYHRMHDWLVEYLSKHRTVTVDMPFTSYTYIADPVNVEHVLKINFTNYPKVNEPPTIHLLRPELYRALTTSPKQRYSSYEYL